MMNKKVYVDFARMIRSQRHKAVLASQDKTLMEGYAIGLDTQITRFTESLCELFQNDNPKFNADKFMQACKLDQK